MADTHAQVVGVNPHHGGPVGLTEAIADDDVLTALAIALRSMPVGSFQSLNGDLRSTEASCKAALDLRAKFRDMGLDFTVMSVKEAKAVREENELLAQGVVVTATSGPSDKVENSTSPPPAPVQIKDGAKATTTIVEDTASHSGTDHRDGTKTEAVKPVEKSK